MASVARGEGDLSDTEGDLSDGEGDLSDGEGRSDGKRVKASPSGCEAAVLK